MAEDFASERDQLERVLKAGPHAGYDHFQMKILGREKTKYLDVSAEQLKTLIDVLFPAETMTKADRALALHLAETLALGDGVTMEDLEEVQARGGFTWDERRTGESQEWHRYTNYRANDWPAVKALAVELAEHPEKL